MTSKKTKFVHAGVAGAILWSWLVAHAAALTPFSANVQTSETLAFNPAACTSAPFLQGTTVGNGNASHMGRVTVASTDCIVPGESSYTFSNGHLVLTASNGDTLTADYSGSLLPTSDPSVFTLSGSYQVTGGTGRFARGTGSGSLQGTSNIVTGQSSYQANGLVAY